MNAYLDNSATTPLDKEVLDAMLPYLTERFGNPSSTHKFGREARSAVEMARKTVARLVNVSPAEVTFTSGGTEADNIALLSGIFNRREVITSPLEHHAVLEPLRHWAERGRIHLHWVNHDAKGSIDLQHLEELLKAYPNAFVSLMHGNNEIGNLNPIREIGKLCQNHGAIFHSDTVQTLGQYPLDLQEIPVDMIVGSAHKFHGPKGVGVLIAKNAVKREKLSFGGEQERGSRPGTENVAGIVGLAKALELAYDKLKHNRQHISQLKEHLIKRIQSELPEIGFNGTCLEPENSKYSLVSLSLPKKEMLLFQLDMQGISASSGSACQSGAGKASEVMVALDFPKDKTALRISLSKMNTMEEMDFLVEKLKTIVG